MLTLNDGRSELWQWDTNRKLTVDAECSQVHFSNKVFGRSIDVDVVDGSASIPDILLQTDKDLIAWAFVGTVENGYTKISKTFKVNKRNKPADYMFTPPDQTTLEELVSRLDAIEESLVEVPEGGGSDGNVEPSEDDIPKVFFGAALPQTKNDTIMSFRYISKTRDISGWCKTKAQGNHSMNYPKKNQTVKLYRDADCTEKLKVNFKDWRPQNKFCFKANWIDLTHARNIVSARLWGDVVNSRQGYENIPELLRTSPNHGAIDGFPVKVYANGIYQGRYTINIPKDAWMANMDDELDAHCILCGENYVSGCFRAEAKIDESDWTDEIHETVPDAIKARWNEVIRFVMNSTDEEFVSGIGNYFDVESLIDYYLFGLVSCGLDGFAKNQIYMTYDGQKWYASMYDMDATWGLWYNGASFVSSSYSRSEYQDFKDGQGNLLYIRLEKLFMDAIKDRWGELKNDTLSLPNIINRFERFTDIASAELVAEDYAETTVAGSFSGIPSKDTNNIQQIRAFCVNRLNYVEEYLNDEQTDDEQTDYEFVLGRSWGDTVCSYNPARTCLNPVVFPVPDGVTTIRFTIPSGYWMGPSGYTAIDPTADFSVQAGTNSIDFGGKITRIADPGWQTGSYDLDVSGADMFGCNFRRDNYGNMSEDDITALEAGFSFEYV